MTKRRDTTSDNGFIFKKRKKNSEPLWKLSHLSTFIHLDKFTKKFSLSLQMKSFQKKINFHAWVNLAIFQKSPDWLDWPRPVQSD